MLAILLSAVAGGVVLNFMPCVFPVLSLKAVTLARHAGAPRQARMDAIAFSGGALASFLILGGVLTAMRSAGVAVNWGFQLQSPVMTGALALVMLAAALNLFGLFEVGGGLQGVGQDLADRPSWVGAVFTGVLSVLVASPCVAPFMAGALGYALVQPAARGLAVFAALGVGFAAPFLLLAFLPGLASRMPRPGPWMSILKQALGFPMVASAAWLVWISSREAGASGLAWLFTASITISLAAWLYGLAQRSRKRGASRVTMLSVAALSALSAVALLPRLRPTSASTAPTLAPAAWSAARVAALRAEGKPIFVNFTASWCVTCQANDRVALSTEAFKKALRRSGAVYLVADATRYDAAIARAMDTFGSAGLPLYVVYPAGGGAPTILPQVLTRSLVLQALSRAQEGSM